MALDKTITDQYLLWCEKAVADPDIVDELKEMSSDEEKIEDAFYRDLAFEREASGVSSEQEPIG